MRGESLRRGAVLSCFVLALAVSPAQAAEVGEISAQELSQLEKYLTEVLTDEGRPGLSAAVVSGEEISTITLGEESDGQPVTADTVFQTASISKSMTALAIAILHESGDIDLSQPVSTYLPELSPGADAVTLADVMHQFSGLSQYVGNQPWVGRLGESLEVNVTRLESEFSAGAFWEYSNANYDTLALVVERVSGMPFPDFMAEHVFAPLDMTFTQIGPTGAETLAEGYYNRLVLGYAPVGIDDRPGMAGSAGIFSTPTDIAHFMSAQLNAGVFRGEQVFPAAAIETVQTPRPYGLEYDEPLPVEPGYAGGFFVGPSFGPEVSAELAGLTTLWHQGDGLLGFQGVMWMVPEAGAGFVVLTNGNDYADSDWIAQVAQGAKHILFGLEPNEPIPRQDPLVRWGKQLLAAVVVAQAALAFAVSPGIRRRRAGVELGTSDRVWISLATIVDLVAVAALVWIIPDTSASPLLVVMEAPDYRVIVLLMAFGILWGIVRTFVLVLRARGKSSGPASVPVTTP